MNRTILYICRFKRHILFVFGVLTFAILIVIGRSVEYLVSEFILCTHPYDGNQMESMPLDNKIPSHIHQIFFFETSDTLPDDLVTAQTSWIQYHPQYQYTLWNKTSINRLIDKDYPFLKKLYHSYGHWVRRADVARYLVLYHYGGWYVDMDVSCKRSLRTLEQEAQSLNKNAIVRETEPCGFSNDFIGISPRHPFLYAVLNSLHKSNRWYIFPYTNTIFSTGPTFLWGRYLNYPDKDKFYIINNSSYGNYVTLLHSSSWHGWDGIIVWYFFKDRKKLIIVLTAAALLCLALLFCKFRTIKPNYTKSHFV